MNPIEHIRKNVFGMTQKEFADAIGVAQPSVSRWERGVPFAHPEMKAIRSVARERGLEWDDRWFFETPASQTSEVAA